MPARRSYAAAAGSPPSTRTQTRQMEHLGNTTRVPTQPRSPPRGTHANSAGPSNAPPGNAPPNNAPPGNAPPNHATPGNTPPNNAPPENTGPSPNSESVFADLATLRDAFTNNANATAGQFAHLEQMIAKLSQSVQNLAATAGGGANGRANGQGNGQGQGGQTNAAAAGTGGQDGQNNAELAANLMQAIQGAGTRRHKTPVLAEDWATFRIAYTQFKKRYS